MILASVLVQEGQISPDARESIVVALHSFTQQHFGEQTTIEWKEVRTGSGFTGGEPSKAVVVSLLASRPVDEDHRERCLRALVDCSLEYLQCAPENLFASIRDPQLEDRG